MRARALFLLALLAVAPASAARQLAADTMTVTVSVLTGLRYTLDVSPNVTVADFRAALGSRACTPSSNLRMIYLGRELQDGLRLGDYGIGHGAVLHAALRRHGEVAGAPGC